MTKPILSLSMAALAGELPSVVQPWSCAAYGCVGADWALAPRWSLGLDCKSYRMRSRINLPPGLTATTLSDGLAILPRLDTIQVRAGYTLPLSHR